MRGGGRRGRIGTSAETSKNMPSRIRVMQTDKEARMKKSEEGRREEEKEREKNGEERKNNGGWGATRAQHI